MAAGPAKTPETALYRPVYEFLLAQGYTVRGEVKHCDIAAVKDEELVVVELKRSLSLALLAQAVQRQQLTESVYLAIPRPANLRKWQAQLGDVKRLLRRLALGLLLVSTEPGQPAVEIVLHPLPYTPRPQKKARRAVLEEVARRSADFNTGGSCRRKLVTAYRENAIRIAVCLERGPHTPRALRALGTDAKTLSILYRNVYGWFTHLDRGCYGLSPQGCDELAQFPELAAKYRALLEKEE